ncbi:MAG: hypothetical protein PHU85_15490 [Phycisphaerae bacterium]|nr:hypothetical protein [Phycisphaerae bacterium]
MARFGAVDIEGKSGSAYKFIAYSLDTVFRRHRPAVYVVTRRRQVVDTEAFKHRRIGVDQTGDLRRLLAESSGFHGVPGANCICVHDELDKDARLAIQKDLRKP